MRISIGSPIRKTAFLGASAVVLLSTWALSWQALLQWHFTRSNTVEGLQRAARIQPLNALTHQTLGTVYLQTDHHRAVSELERAVQLNPYSADAWLHLADAYSVLGDSGNERRAIFAVLKVAPRDTSSQWQAATLLLAEGDTGEGLKLMREVVSNDPSRAPAAMQIGFAVSGGDIARALTALPDDPSVRLQFMQWLIERQRFSDCDLVWSEIMKSGQPFPGRDAFFYIDSLIEHQQVAMAQRAWQAVASSDKQLARRSESGNTITNSGFEDNLLNAAFDWRYVPVSGVEASIDTSTFHAGTQALSLRLDGGNPQDFGVYQFIPVEPDACYSVKAFVRGEEIESANGIRVIVSDAYSGHVYFTGDEQMGSFPWREIVGEFTTGHDSKLMRLAIGRSPAEGRIRGRFWIDDLRMEKR